MPGTLPITKYHQVYLVLREQLQEGRFAQGLPGELALTQQFGVGRVTVRRALEQLVQEGLIVLPKSVTLATAPEPIDPRVELREVPARRIAAIRYSGTWSQANYDEHLQRLRSALRAARIEPAGAPTLSRYNGPMTPWFMRRNEIWLPLEAGGR